MKDVRGVTISLGATVVVAWQPGRARYDLSEGTIVGFTPKMVKWRQKGYPAEHYFLASPYKVAVVS